MAETFNFVIPALLNKPMTLEELLARQVLDFSPDELQEYLDRNADWIEARLKWIYLRTRLAEAQNWKCCYCGTKCNTIPEHRRQATLDHVIAKSVGGSDDPDNLVLACARCNKRRGNMTVDDFMIGYKAQCDRNRILRNEELMRKVAKAIKKAAKFKERGWTKVNGSSLDKEEWLKSLRLPSDKTQVVREAIA